jgi:hypothetical protein
MKIALFKPVMRHLGKRHETKSRGQTALEYMMAISSIIIPLAVAVKVIMKDTGEADKPGVVRSMVSDSYGDRSRMGVIGRPYP